MMESFPTGISLKRDFSEPLLPATYAGAMKTVDLHIVRIDRESLVHDNHFYLLER